MHQKVGDIWENFEKPLHYVVFTTNQNIFNAELIMGAGIALEAKKRFPELPKLIAAAIVGKQNPYYLVELPRRLIALQTKINWRDPSPLDLVEESIKRLGELAAANPIYVYNLPKLGCGNGNLRWDNQVKPLCNKYLASNCIVWDRKSL